MFKKYSLEITVFICGATVMIFELVGSRVLAPYLGTSMFIWTSLIGVILASLSLGYYLGGKYADKDPSLNKFSSLLFSAALAVFLTILINSLVFSFYFSQNKTSLASFYTNYILKNLELSSFFISLILFAPASIFLGMISPYAVKLKIKNIEASGSVVGNLYAFSTVGSILGTFLAGFFLLPSLGATKILIILPIILTLLSLFVSAKKLKKLKILFILFLLFFFYFNGLYTKAFERITGIFSFETKYSHFQISSNFEKNGRQLLTLSSDPYGTQSAIFLEGEDDLVANYQKYYRLVQHFNPAFKKALMIGGAGYNYPRDYLKKFPEKEIDVVEIDEKLTSIAKEYFRLTDDPRLTIYNEDGRTFLNRNTQKYDAIFCDAFQSVFSLPYQLTTQEAISKMHTSLNENGIVMVNIVSSLQGPSGKFLQAEYLTYKSVFPQVYIFAVNTPDKQSVQSIMLLALKSEKKPPFESSDSELNQYLKTLWKEGIATPLPILTDDFAPVDSYISQLF